MSVLVKISVVVLAISLGLVTVSYEIKIWSEIIINFFFLQVWSQQNTTLSPTALKDRCAYLNSVRSNFTSCCKYPTIVLWRWMLNSCKDECQRNFQADNDCCPLVCNYRRINVIPQANDTSRNATWNPVAGLTYAFMLSIGNDTRWTQTVSDSLNFCFNSVIKQPLYDVCGIPLHLYDIINCAYNQLFLRCPVWDPSNITECAYTREFINICFTN